MTSRPISFASVFMLILAVTTFPLSALAALNDPPQITRIDPPAEPGSMAPYLFVSDHHVLLSWLELITTPDTSSNERHPDYRLRCARYEDGSWSVGMTRIATYT